MLEERPQVGNTNGRKPTEGNLKCNMDAAALEQDQKIGISIYIGDEVGNFREGKTMSFQGALTPQEEALRLWQRLNWWRGLSLVLKAIELECLSVVTGVNIASPLNT